MARLQPISLFLDAFLDNDCIKDDSWNGLQVAGNEDVSKVVFAVDAGMETFEHAHKAGADMVVVHHGLFWKSANPSLVMHNKKRIEFLVKHGMSLYGAHLPLDLHPEVGNNAQLLNILGFEKECEFGVYAGQTISFIGGRDQETTLVEIEKRLEQELGATCKILPFGPGKISRIAVCSGGGASFGLLMEAVHAGVDLYLTGDSTEMYQIAKDMGINIIFAGHHATEIVGVRALADVVRKKCGVETEFIDIPTGL